MEDFHVLGVFLFLTMSPVQSRRVAAVWVNIAKLTWLLLNLAEEAWCLLQAALAVLPSVPMLTGLETAYVNLHEMHTQFWDCSGCTLKEVELQT